MNVGAGPICGFILGIPGNATIAASMAGTAAATSISASIPCSFASSMSIFNLTGRNLELVLGPDNGTASYTTAAGVATVEGQGSFFVPGTASSVAQNMRIPVQLSQGMKFFVRTTENTPITCSSTTPLVINLWA